MSELLGGAWPTTGLALRIERVDRNRLVKEYVEARRNAPRRGDRGKRFFVEGHDGRLSGKKTSARFEEHLAMAIWRFRDARWPRPDGGWWRCLDYQFPLKAEQADARVGKIDLFGVTESGRLVVCELKVAPGGKDRGKGPMDALKQALGYAAIVEANSTTIGEEAMDVFGVPSISDEPPMLQILAPKAWWRRWFLMEDSTRRKAGPWEVRFGELVDDIRDRLDIVVECVAMDRVSKTALSGPPAEPTLRSMPTMSEVRFGGPLELDRLSGKFRALPMAHGGKGPFR